MGRNPYTYALTPAFLEILIAARLRVGMTQQQLAEAIGTRQSAVSDLEAGRHVPQLGTLTRWAEALGLRVDLRLEPARSAVKVSRG